MLSERQMDGIRDAKERGVGVAVDVGVGVLVGVGGGFCIIGKLLKAEGVNTGPKFKSARRVVSGPNTISVKTDANRT